METVYLKTFLEVVAAGSFSKAAEKLFVTQSAVSRRVQLLEEMFGSPLLDRSGAVLAPTIAGHTVLRKTGMILELEEDLGRELRSIHMGKEITFCCTPPFGSVYLPAILKTFMFKNLDTGNLKFFFKNPEDALRGLREKLYDLAVIEHCDCLDLKGLESIPLPDDEMIFVSSPALNIPTPIANIDLLVSHPLYIRDTHCCSYKFLEMNMESTGRKMEDFNNIIIMDDLNIIIHCVLMGHGISYIPLCFVKKQILDGNLSSHNPNRFFHTRKRSLIYPKTNGVSKIASGFMDCVVSAFEREPPRSSRVFRGASPSTPSPRPDRPLRSSCRGVR